MNYKSVLMIITISLIHIVNAETMNTKINVDTINNTVSIYVDELEKHVYDCDKNRKQIIILETDIETNNDRLSQQIDLCKQDNQKIEKEINLWKQNNQKIEKERVELEKSILEEELKNKDCVSNKMITESYDKIIEKITNMKNKEDNNLKDDIKFKNMIIMVLIIFILGLIIPKVFRP